MIEINSVDLLFSIVQNRKWYYLNGKPIFSNSYANIYKQRILDNKLNSATADKILKKLGYQKKEFWFKN
jgi:hypothetical protein